MLLLEDTAIILRVDAYGERDALISAFAPSIGVVRGVARNAMTSKQRGIYCIGNLVELRWQARLEEHLGQVSAELLSPSGSMLMGQREFCYALQSMASLTLMAFETQDPHPALFNALQAVIDAMRFGLPWHADYARFEAVLLREAGFGLGLERCIVTGQADALRYLSPKSGCAVCAQEGAPYAEKLFVYPALLTQEMHTLPPHEAAVTDALAITEHFIARWLLPALDKPMPAARARLMGAIAATKHAAEPA
jgi:DNA repair protein RecO (recombination protein O)